MASGQRPAAFFDVDGTLLTVQSGTLYLGYLRRNGLMDLSDLVRIYWSFLTYRLGMLNVKGLAEVSSRWLAGQLESDVAEHCRHWYETEVAGYFSEAMLGKVAEHQSAGHVVALLTGGTRYLNDWIAADLGIEHLLASRLEVREGRFTGQPVGPLCYGRGKIAHAEAFAEDQGIDFAESWFYSDSITDMPMLERVGYPVAVNPDPRLRLEAKRRRLADPRRGARAPTSEGTRHERRVRIVSLVPSLTETLASWGLLGQRLAGRTRYCVEPAGAIDTVEVVGGTKNPDIMRIRELRPDLVVVNREENRREDYDALVAAGLNVHVTHPRTVGEAADMLEDLGRVVGERLGTAWIWPAAAARRARSLSPRRTDRRRLRCSARSGGTRG